MSRRQTEILGKVIQRGPHKIVVKSDGLTNQNGNTPIVTIMPRVGSIVGPFAFLLDRIGQTVLFSITYFTDSKKIKIIAGDETYEETVPYK